MYNYNWPCMPYMNMYDDDLERMYPEIYHRAHPMVMMHCDKMEEKYGWMFSPSNKDLSDACEDMYENLKDYLEEMEEKDHDDDKCYSRQQPYDRRRSVNDLLRILLIRELLGRRRRRRRRPHHGYWY